MQLRERHWRIFSLSGTLETVRGRGVAGQVRCVVDEGRGEGRDGRVQCTNEQIFYVHEVACARTNRYMRKGMNRRERV